MVQCLAYKLHFCCLCILWSIGIGVCACNTCSMQTKGRFLQVLQSHCMNGVFTAMKSWLQKKKVSPSQCKAEYKTTTGRSNEGKFVPRLVENMRITVVYPIHMNMNILGQCFLVTTSAAQGQSILWWEIILYSSAYWWKHHQACLCKKDKKFADYHTKLYSAKDLLHVYWLWLKKFIHDTKTIKKQTSQEII